MRILFLLSCLEPAGSETYCLSLADAWKGKHDVFWISDRLHYGQPYTSMPIHRKAFPMGVINVIRVAAFIRRHKIDLVHSHSRRAHWVAAQAAFLTRIPHVTTIHQPLPVHFFSKLFPCLGDQAIAIDEAVADHLIGRFGHPKDKISLIRNGIDLSSLVPTQRQSPSMKQILMIGRLTGGRWRTFQFFLEVLERSIKSLPPAHYKIVGQVPDERRSTLIPQLSVLGSKIAPSRIELLGYVKDLSTLIRNSDGAIAAGRSALECLAQARPVILMGEGGVLGLCRADLWPAALRTNLGDHLEPKDFNAGKLEAALRELLSPGANLSQLGAWGRAQIEKDFNLRPVASQVETVYRRAM